MVKIDASVKKTLKKRNLNKLKTRKLLENFQDNPTKYLSFKELKKRSRQNINQNYNWLFKKIKDSLVQSPTYNTLDSETQTMIQIANQSTNRAYDYTNYKSYLQKLNQKDRKNCGSILNYENDIMLLKMCGKSYDNYHLAKYNQLFKVLDVDRLSKGFQYFDLTDIEFSPNNTYLSFCIDFIGNKNYIFFTQNIHDGKISIHNLSRGNNEIFMNLRDSFRSNDQFNFVNNIQSTNNYLWVSEHQIMYVAMNKKYSTKKCYLYDVQSKKRKLIYKCDDKEKMMYIKNTYSDNYILLFLETYRENEVYLINQIEDSNGRLKFKIADRPIISMIDNVYYEYINQIDSVWYICKRSNGQYKFLSTQDFNQFDVLHTFKNKHSIIHNVIFLDGFFVFIHEALTKLCLYKYEIDYNQTIKNKKAMQKININIKGGPKKQKRNNHSLVNEICPYTHSCRVQPANLYSTEQEILFRSMSFTHPGHVFSLTHDVHNNELVPRLLTLPNAVRKLNEKHLKLYNEETLLLRNKNISLHFIYSRTNKNTKINNLKDLKDMKTIVIGYGAYGSITENTYDFNHCLTLVNAGYLVVVVSVRGDGKLGTMQHQKGIKLHKKNSFDDFAYALQYLYKKKISSPEKCAVWGRSAGGLLIGSLINQYTDLCCLAIMGVPFLMPYDSLLSDQIPLSHESRNEWGNPKNKEYAKYIQSYDPYLNINVNHNYPNIFVYSNTDDSISMFQESLKYYNKIKDAHVFKNGSKNVHLYMDTKYGHNQGSSFNEHNKTYAMIFAMIDKYLR